MQNVFVRGKQLEIKGEWLWMSHDYTVKSEILVELRMQRRAKMIWVFSFSMKVQWQNSVRDVQSKETCMFGTEPNKCHIIVTFDFNRRKYFLYNHIHSVQLLFVNLKR